MTSATLENILFPLGMNKIRTSQLKQIAMACLNQPFENYRSDDFLRSMPGVGFYISNVVRSCVFGEAVPALDANMIRVLQRVFGWKSERKRPREDRKLWTFAETLVPNKHSCEFNWGILDFASTICKHKNPKCFECFFKSICNYYQKTVTTNDET